MARGERHLNPSDDDQNDPVDETCEKPDRREFLQGMVTTTMVAGVMSAGTSCSGGSLDTPTVDGGVDASPDGDNDSVIADGDQDDPRTHDGSDGDRDSEHRQPNIIVFFSDQQRNCSWSIGSSSVYTPNLEALALQGAMATQCISSYPLCSPHRASLLSGRYPQAHGVLNNIISDSLAFRTSEPSIATVLRDAGYATGYVGKWHLYPGAQNGTLVPAGAHRHGFDDYWRACHNNADRDDTRCYDDEGNEFVLPDYAPTNQMDMTLDFIRENADRPFCVFLSVHPPHNPYSQAPPEFDLTYPLGDIELRPNVPEAFDTLETAQDYKGYYEHISALDHELGRLMTTLEELDLEEDTILVYTSDHGDMLHSHGLQRKSKPWEEAINVPFVVRWPRVIRPGQPLDALLSTPDIAPTLLGLAGLGAPPLMQGMDLSHLLRGEEGDEPESALLMTMNHWADGSWRGVRTQRYTFARRLEADGSVRRWVLYDNQEDPFQLTNLVEDESAQPIRQELNNLLREWLDLLGDDFLE